MTQETPVPEVAFDVTHAPLVLATLPRRYDGEIEALLASVATAAGAFQARAALLSRAAADLPESTDLPRAVLHDTAASAEALSRSIDDVLWRLVGTSMLAHRVIQKLAGEGRQSLAPERILPLTQEIELQLAESAGHASLLALNTTVEAACAGDADPTRLAATARSVVDQAVQTTEAIAWQAARILQRATQVGTTVASILADRDHRPISTDGPGTARAA